MFATHRQSEILRIVRAQHTCTIADLANTFAVSDETVRRDLKPLVAEGLLVKVHGGVMLPAQLDEPPFRRRMVEQRDAKRAIAARIAQMIRDGDSLMLDGGTTCVHIAHALEAHAQLTVVTNSAEIARLLAPRNGNRVLMAGGELRADDASAVGDSALAFFRQFHVRYAIVSVTAIDAKGRFMDAQPADAVLARTAFAQAERRIVAADHTKFGHSALAHVFGAEALDVLVTDVAPAAGLSKVLAAAGAEVICAASAAYHADEEIV
ncbi:DeoR/GlpR transcriptional regulator [Paraburkholderia sp. LEh10]|jgi:DeoR family glycerol-3-phosphate regulon repressor|uniref:DeoR/GlpR family DNA-binding transcription regulator n=1 Tax=Paraburkholderia sp. LEh10 TaxID=2821353 RepID=UPI001AE9C2A0|nr:DeoR/GlpR family DNA-binding transcription regulator [Paraburkholderia sp. LEh10]MBP0592536.1 DeoR/GlpR transcriptional regulator [Paraburkholderia sp. LEh10]